MNRRDFVSLAALTGLAAAPASRAVINRAHEGLQCRCTCLDDPLEADVDLHAPAGLRLDLMGSADDERLPEQPGFGLKAIYAGLLGGQEFTLIHPANGDLHRGGSLHFARNSLAGLEVRWSQRRAFLPVASLFGHRPRSGYYRLDIKGQTGEQLSLALRLVRA